jgi:hypothetical protein
MWLAIVFIVLVLASMLVYFINRPIGFIAMQVSIALVFVYATYALSLWVLRRDKLVVDNKYKYDSMTKTLLINGYVDSYNLQNSVIDTFNKTSLSFAAMPRSINRQGGAQFTYQFWMLLTNPGAVGFKDILVKGDVTPYSLMTVNAITNQVLSRTQDVIIKCPRIRFYGAFNELAVEVNTLADPNPPPFRISPAPSNNAGGGGDGGDNTMRQNILKLGLNRWVLYTFVFKDRVNINDFENGIEMSFYHNDMLYQKNTMQSALRQNYGNLYLFPSGAIEGCRLGDLAYYNYATSLDEIVGVYERGPPQSLSTVTKDGGAIATPLFLTEYNKLNIYNS